MNLSRSTAVISNLLNAADMPGGLKQKEREEKRVAVYLTGDWSSNPLLLIIIFPKLYQKNLKRPKMKNFSGGHTFQTPP